MSGHSKWATTKRQKAIVDAKKSSIFTKIGNLITIAARKGNDPTANFSLRLAIEKARAANLPKDNIERAIKRGAGELAGAQIEELIYEGIGPAKTQFIVKCLTDNKNRSAAEVRHLFTKYGGSLGAVMWNFSQKGVLQITNYELPSSAKALEDKRIANLENDESFELELIDNGAQDILKETEGMAVYTKPEDFQRVKLFLENKKVKTESAEIEYIAKKQVNLTEEEKTQVQKFIDELEDSEDVSDYYTNANL